MTLADMQTLKGQFVQATQRALAAGFDWLDRPDVVAVERAERLLEMLGALADGELTAEGRQMLRLPMHRQARSSCRPQRDTARWFPWQGG
jgi:HrpA-like RNA helicase